MSSATVNVTAKQLAEAIGPVLKEAFKVRDDRILDLERRLADLEKVNTGDATEWPIPQRTSA